MSNIGELDRIPFDEQQLDQYSFQTPPKIDAKNLDFDSYIFLKL